jgi:acyl-CoA thioesterase-2
MAASFHVTEDGSDYQAHPMPDVDQPEDLPNNERWHRMHGVEIRLPAQPNPGQQWPSRLWIRSRHKLDGDMLNTCGLAYVSDMFTGLAATPGITIAGPLTSIDHSVWFFRRAELDDWVLMDLQPESTGGGRGMNTGRIFTRDGALAAGIAQETLFRPGTARTGPLTP